MNFVQTHFWKIFAVACVLLILVVSITASFSDGTGSREIPIFILAPPLP